MSSKDLILASTQALVPSATRRQQAALDPVRTAAMISGLQLAAAGRLAELASDDATQLAIIHEAMIKAAPLADDALAQIRNAHARSAVRIIDRMAGQ